jgi:hypothetical protein
MANAPLSGPDGGDMKVICAGCERKYFCKEGWTACRLVCPSGCQIEPKGEIFFSVIPGHREAMSPESITPIGGYGFRACAKRRIPE